MGCLLPAEGHVNALQEASTEEDDKMAIVLRRACGLDLNVADEEPVSDGSR